jgi:putative peptidoglycan lipid II flippase
MAAAAPFYLPFLGSGFEPGKLWVTRKLLYLLLPIIILNGVAGVWSSALNAHERFTLPALTPAATPLLIVLGLYVLAKRWGIFVLAGGTVAGAIAEAYLMAQAARQCGISLQVRWFGLTPDVRAVIRQYVPTFAGTLVLSISPIIDQSMAAMLKPGSVAALSYGYKIVIGIVALTSVGLSTAVLPYFAQMVAKRDWRECRHTVRIYSLLVLAVTVPIAIGLMLWSGQVVRALFQRGAFTETDTVLVSAIQIRFALIIPLASWTILFVRLLSALERSDVLVHSAVLSAFLNIVFNVVFMRKWGVAGIALSTTVVCAVICVFMGIRALHLLDRQEAQGAASWKTQDAGQ